PAKFRKELGGKAVITRGLDNCLFVFTKTEWGKLADKIGSLPLGQSDARGFARLMLSGAMEVSTDRLGRILVPDYLKQYASLKKQVIVTGVYNRIEVWDENTWNLYKKRSEKDAGNMAERLGELGL
ncbi:MAG: division/cell wall cluster transcriptional repressor MraZ, partial [Candidatus Spechtbacteria bacterium RIFCSPLOWO2_01_FULL_43_12]